MCAYFDDLHDVAQVLTEHIREETGIQDVQAGQPRDVSASTAPAARITLLYSTTQPAHRNDDFEPGAGGGMRPPPLSLSCFYLVTTSGSDGDDPVGAHHALGQVMRLYHDVPCLQLPLSANPGSPPGVFTDLGDGALAVTQVPMTIEQIDHIWTPLTEQLQPWALFEVSPVQLVSHLPDTPLLPVVRPGGIVLDEPVGLRPLVLGTTPAPARPSGRLRVDVSSPTAVDGLWLDRVHVAAGDPALEVTTGAGVSTVLVDLSRSGLVSVGAGAHTLIVGAGGLSSRTAVVQLVAGVPVLDAPPEAAHDRTTDLLLHGIELGDVQEIVAWPDRGVGAPTDVHPVAFTSHDAESLTLHAAGGLADLPRTTATWRVSARLTGQHYTPYVVLELQP